MSAAEKIHAPAHLESNPFDWTDPLLLSEELSEEDLEKVSSGYIGETEKNVSCEKLSIDGWHRVAVMK